MVENLRNQYLKSVQIVLFNEKGFLLDSCNTIWELKATDSAFYLPEVFPFLKEDLAIINSLPIGQKLSVPGVKVEINNQCYLINLTFQKDEEQNANVGLIQFVQEITEENEAQKDSTLESVEIYEQKVNFLRKEIVQLKRQQRLKLEFFAKITHDIKIPLTEITGISHLLQRHINEEQGIERLKALEASTMNLNKMLNDLLDFAKTQSNQISFASTDFVLQSVVCNAVRGMEFRSQEKNLPIHLTIDESIPTILKGDPTRLSQILNNLLSNAIKYTDEGHIELDVRTKDTRQNQSILTFVITDTGVGISKEKLPNIFNVFEQVDDAPTKNNGFGLGLTIVKQLTELQGGTVEAVSKLNEGSIFTVTLPFYTSKRREESSSNQAYSAT